MDEELIYAFYDQQLPADVCSGHSFEQWFRAEQARNPKLLLLTRDELMRPRGRRHHHQRLPQDHALGRGGLRRPPTCTSRAMHATA